jgi:hypothetical protein
MFFTDREPLTYPEAGTAEGPPFGAVIANGP